jgi:hypothetical protein
MYVIFDSNIWISASGLNTIIGSAVRFFVKNSGATVVVPEVVKLETERHLKADLTKYIDELEKNHRQLLAVFGNLKELVLPSIQEIEEKVAGVFGNCQMDILELPFSLGSAKRSFMRTVDKLPPSDKDQQFKDGLIWEEILLLLETADVYLVTNDKAFFSGRDLKKGLADTLSREAKCKNYNIYIFSELSELLEKIKAEVRLEENTLVSQFWETHRQSIDNILERNGFAVAGAPKVVIDLYVTEDTDRLYSEFSISYHCEDLMCDGRTDAVLLLKGDCTYLVRNKELSGLRNHGEELSFKTKDGEEKLQRNVVLYAGIGVIGHRIVEHTVKYKLDDQNGKLD